MDGIGVFQIKIDRINNELPCRYYGCVQSHLIVPEKSDENMQYDADSLNVLQIE